ncbi:putative membrane protein [Pseudoxanthomonas sp. GM95]|uniref:PH domain-containing protein n=1 Tax=Pseudoxanthomonas sp. GM95 TaxID=1881043 RepID=UPI0008BA8167|nr:PH domain-containing protein [Pseudoxanthomonas sp. GM95]SEL56064.1 putative membrane protein [Pseudoxanthomonas sp. GM95]
MSSTSEASSASANDQRLHPWSWLFVLLQQLKQFLLPLIVLVVFGGRDGERDYYDNIATAVVMAILVGISVMRYLTYRYRIGSEGLSIRSGLFNRSRREIPFARIHNVVVHQSLLHRLFGVAELRLESAGGTKPEAQMRVLRLDQALALEQLVRHRGQATPEHATEASDSNTLLTLPLGEIVRLGLISNRGMIVMAATAGAAYQMFPQKMVANALEDYGRQVLGYTSHLHMGWLSWAITAASLLLWAIALLRVLSIVLAVVQYHGFRLSETDRRLTVERGLLTRMRTSAARRRIQSWTLREGVLHRAFKRRSLRIDTAVAESHGEQDKSIRELVPLATPDTCDALVQHVLPGVQWPPSQWHAVPSRHWWRLCLWPVFWLAGLAAALWPWLGAPSLLVLLWLPWSAFKAHRQVRRMGWSVDARLVTVRGGWWTRWWRFAEVDKLQALRLSRSPLDRWCDTATLLLDTAGAFGDGPRMTLRFVPTAQARALHEQLTRTLARRQLRW